MTLKDMVRSMICHSTSPESLWGETLKTVAYIFNRVPTIVTTKTLYELWMGKKPNLKHLHVWGCLAKSRPYKPNENKLDSKVVSYYSIVYLKRSKGYKFYDTTIKSIFELGNARFFEDVEFVRGDTVRDFFVKEKYLDILIGVNGIDQGLILDFVQGTTNQDNVGESPIKEVVLKEQMLLPQEPMPLRRSTREMRSTVPDDYIK